jgi:hypothetical protein
VAIETHEIKSKDEWLELRKAFITASMIGGMPAFNCHPYYTPLHIYAEKRGVEFVKDPDDKVMRRGRWLEPAVATAVGELHPEWELTQPKVFLCDREIGIGATPDYYISGDPRGLGVLQCKTVAYSVWKRDWDEGHDLPLWVTLQCLTETMLAGAAFGVVAVMLVDPHNMDCVILDVPRHMAAEHRIVNETKRFWFDIRNGIEPQVDFVRDGAILKLLMPREAKDSVLDLTGNNEFPDLFARRAAMIAEMKLYARRCKIIETKLMAIMRDHAAITGLDGWSASYKIEHRKGYSVAPSEPRVLRIKDRRPLEQRPQVDEDDDVETGE